MLSVRVPNANSDLVHVARSLGIVFSERRTHKRFPIIARAEYVLGGIGESAITRDISSGGVFLKTDKFLRLGAPIQVLIDWPVLLNRRCPLRLEIIGTVIRSDEIGTAVGLIRYDFRLRAPNRTPVVATTIS